MVKLTILAPPPCAIIARGEERYFFLEVSRDDAVPVHGLCLTESHLLGSSPGIKSRRRRAFAVFVTDAEGRIPEVDAVYVGFFSAQAGRPKANGQGHGRWVTRASSIDHGVFLLPGLRRRNTGPWPPRARSGDGKRGRGRHRERTEPFRRIAELRPGDGYWRWPAGTVREAPDRGTAGSGKEVLRTVKIADTSTWKVRWRRAGRLVENELLQRVDRSFGPLRDGTQVAFAVPAIRQGETRGPNPPHHPRHRAQREHP
jgi:hypothetical protein